MIIIIFFFFIILLIIIVVFYLLFIIFILFFLKYSFVHSFFLLDNEGKTSKPRVATLKKLNYENVLICLTFSFGHYIIQTFLVVCIYTHTHTNQPSNHNLYPLPLMREKQRALVLKRQHYSQRRQTAWSQLSAGQLTGNNMSETHMSHSSLHTPLMEMNKPIKSRYGKPSGMSHGHNRPCVMRNIYMENF